MDQSNITDITSPEKSLSLIELVRNICKYINYRLQYQLSQVSNPLKAILIGYVWESKFREVQMKIYSTNDIIMTNKIGNDHRCDEYEFVNEYDLMARNAIHFNTEDMKMFLNMNQNNIRKLKIERKSSERVEVLLSQKFENLKYLNLRFLDISFDQLEKLAYNCKNIETLNIFRCFCPWVQMSGVNATTCLETLQNMKCLKNLSLGHIDENDYELSTVFNIINKLNLQELRIESSILKDDAIGHSELDVDKLKNYKVFKMGRLVNQGNSYYFQKDFLRKFENLRHMYLDGESITHSTFQLLQSACANLTQLSLNYCKILYFDALPKLKEFNALHCSGLTCHNLKTILNEMNLKTFTSIENSGDDDFVPFPISPELQSFKIEYNSPPQNIIKLFNHSYNSTLVNLKELHLINTHPFDSYNGMKINLRFAPNLRELYVDLPIINISDLLELKHLQKLVIIHCTTQQMRSLQQLLKHENFKELSIKYYTCDMDYMGLVSRLDFVTTHLRYFNIPEEFIQYERDFVFDLLNANTRLSLKCAVRNFMYVQDFIRDFVANGQFPQRFRSINICGISMDRDSILDESVEFLQILKLFQGTYYFKLE